MVKEWDFCHLIAACSHDWHTEAMLALVHSLFAISSPYLFLWSLNSLQIFQWSLQGDTWLFSLQGQQREKITDLAEVAVKTCSGAQPQTLLSQHTLPRLQVEPSQQRNNVHILSLHQKKMLEAFGLWLKFRFLPFELHLLLLLCYSRGVMSAHPCWMLPTFSSSVIVIAVVTE